MRKLFALISLVGLALIIVPAFLYLGGSLDKPTMKMLMLAGTIGWFVTVPLWMGRNGK